MTRPFARIALGGVAAEFPKPDSADDLADLLCDNARFFLPLLALEHGFSPADMLNRLVAKEVQSIGIARLETVRRQMRAQPKLTTIRNGADAGGERETRAARIYDEGDTRC
jgi:hypothetical protein